MIDDSHQHERDAVRIRSVALRILRQIAPEANLENLNADVAFADQFDFDSVNCLNFVLALGRELRVEIPESDCHRLSTLNGCLEYLVPKVTV
jgi:acyl carrier protein